MGFVIRGFKSGHSADIRDGYLYSYPIKLPTYKKIEAL